MQVTPYLTFEGQCEEAFRFYQRVIGGRIVMMLRFSEAPDGGHPPPGMADKIMHARLMFGDQALMASDAPPGHGGPISGFCINLGIDDPDEAERVFAGLSEGGQVTMAIAPTFWAQRFGMLIDKYGVPWMVNCETAQPQEGAKA